MTIGQLGMKHPSLAGMVAAIQTHISREALHQRFTAAASDFLYRCLQFVMHQKIHHAPVSTELLNHYPRVVIVDSSSWDISEKLKDLLPGSGGSASKANCKLQAAYEYKRGELDFLDVTSGIVPDNRYTNHLPDMVNKNDLLLFDQGYFKLATFTAVIEKEAFFLTRFMVGTILRDSQTMVTLDLRKKLYKQKSNTCQMNILMGKKIHQAIPCRLVCLRVSDQIANERRRKLRKQSKKKGRTVSKYHLALCNWTLLITNVPDDWLPLKMVRALYTLRWQIELLFKQIKSILCVHKSDTANEHRLRCELYGKLIAAVLVHRIHGEANNSLWNTKRREVSMDKLYKRIQERAFLLSQLFQSSLNNAIAYLFMEIENLLKYCMKNLQRSRITTLEMLEIGIDPRLYM